MTKSTLALALGLIVAGAAVAYGLADDEKMPDGGSDIITHLERLDDQKLYINLSSGEQMHGQLISVNRAEDVAIFKIPPGTGIAYVRLSHIIAFRTIDSERPPGAAAIEQRGNGQVFRIAGAEEAVQRIDE